MFSSQHVEALFRQATCALQRSCTMLDEQCASRGQSGNSSTSSSGDGGVGNRDKTGAALRDTWMSPHAPLATSIAYTHDTMTVTAAVGTAATINASAVVPHTRIAALSFAGVVRLLHALARLRAYTAACDALALRLSRELVCASHATRQRRLRGDAFPLLRRVVGFVCNAHRDVCNRWHRDHDTNGEECGKSSTSTTSNADRCAADDDVVAALYFDDSNAASAAAVSECGGAYAATMSMCAADMRSASSPSATASPRAVAVTRTRDVFDSGAGVAALLLLRAVYMDMAHSAADTLAHAVRHCGVVAHVADATRRIARTHTSHQGAAADVATGGDGRDCAGGVSGGCSDSEVQRQPTCDGVGLCTCVHDAALCQLLTSALEVLPTRLADAVLARLACSLRGVCSAVQGPPSSAPPPPPPSSYSLYVPLLHLLLLLRGVVRCLLVQMLHRRRQQLTRSVAGIFAACVLQPLQQSVDMLYALYLRDESQFAVCSHYCICALATCTDELLLLCAEHSHGGNKGHDKDDANNAKKKSCAPVCGEAVCAHAPGRDGYVQLLQRLHQAVLCPLEAHFTSDAARPGMARTLYTHVTQPYVQAMQRYTDPAVAIHDRITVTRTALRRDDSDAAVSRLGGDAARGHVQTASVSDAATPSTTTAYVWYHSVVCTAVYRALMLVEAVAQAEVDMASGTMSATRQQRRYKSMLAQSNGKMTMTLLSTVAEDRQLLLDATTIRAPTGHKVHKMHDGCSYDKCVLLYIDDGIIHYKSQAMQTYKQAGSVHEVLQQLSDDNDDNDMTSGAQNADDNARRRCA